METRAQFLSSMREETGTKIALNTRGVGTEAVGWEGPRVAQKVGPSRE